MKTYYADGYITVVDLSDNTELDEIFKFVVVAKNEKEGKKEVERLATEKYKEELELDDTKCEKMVIENFYQTTEDARSN